MLELWKPLVVKAKKGIPIICNVFEDKLNHPYRPFIIFYDDNAKSYYYLRARSAVKFDKDNKPFMVKPNKYEMLVDVEEDAEQELFRTKTYVDCSQIFKCDCRSLELLIDKDSTEYKETYPLDINDINEIKNNILKAVMEHPPYLSIINVDVDFKNKISIFKSLYLAKDLFNDEASKLNVNKYNFDYFNSLKKVNPKRFETGIEFCLKFLKVYFSDVVKNFLKTQNLDSKMFNKINKNSGR